MSSESLFREEAIASKQKLVGTVSLSSPPYRWLWVAVASALALSAGLLFVFGTYTARERVVGQLVPTRGVLNIVPPLSGTITEVRVREGQQVAKGDVLMVVSAEVDTDLGGTRQMVGQQLVQQREKLKIDLLGQSQLSGEETSGIRQRIDILRDQVALLQRQAAHRKRQVDLANRQLEKMRSMLSDGYVSSSQIEQQEGASIEATASLQDVVRQQLDLNTQLTQAEQMLREQPLRARTQQHDVERRLNDVDQAIAENEARRSTVLRAPQDGVIGALIAKSGQVVSAGQTVASLLPADAQLEATLLVPSRAIGFIREGQRVVLRYQAFPYQKFGQQYGKVLSVSTAALSPQEQAYLTGQPNAQEQHYLVSVALNRQDIAVYDRNERLRPGMALEADLLIDKRRLIEWVLEPLYALGRRASG